MTPQQTAYNTQHARARNKALYFPKEKVHLAMLFLGEVPEESGAEESQSEPEKSDSEAEASTTLKDHEVHHLRTPLVCLALDSRFHWYPDASNRRGAELHGPVDRKSKSGK